MEIWEQKMPKPVPKPVNGDIMMNSANQYHIASANKSSTRQTKKKSELMLILTAHDQYS